jgi:hypothetical protein
MASLGIGFADYSDAALTLKETRDSDYRHYVYPYMLNLNRNKTANGLYSVGFWTDNNWMVMLF